MGRPPVGEKTQVASPQLLEPPDAAVPLRQALRVVYLLLFSYYLALGVFLATSRALLQRVGGMAHHSALVTVAFTVFIVALTETLCAPFWAALCDRAGRRWTILVGAAAQIVGFASFTKMTVAAWMCGATLIGSMHSIDVAAFAIALDCVRASVKPGDKKDACPMRFLRQVLEPRVDLEADVTLSFTLLNVPILSGFVGGLAVGGLVVQMKFLLNYANLVGAGIMTATALVAWYRLPETAAHRGARYGSKGSIDDDEETESRSSKRLDESSASSLSMDKSSSEDSEYEKDSSPAKLDALKPADVCEQLIAAIVDQTRTIEVLFATPERFVLGLTYFAVHLQTACLFTGIYWAGNRFPFLNVAWYYTGVILAAFFCLVLYSRGLQPTIGDPAALGLCLAVTTAARFALTSLDVFADVLHGRHPAEDALLFLFIFAAVFTVGLVPIVNGLLAVRLLRRDPIANGHAQGGVLAISKYAILIALIADAVCTHYHHQALLWLLPPVVSAVAAAFAASCFQQRSRLAPEDAAPILPGLTDDQPPELAALYGTFSPDIDLF